MKIGLCCSKFIAERAKLAGFDYWETSISQTAPLPKEEFSEILKLCEGIDFYPETGYQFFNNDKHRLVGEDVREDELLEWSRLSLERAKALRMQVVVIGGGGARKIPEGFPRERAVDQFGGLLFKMGEIAKPLGITLVVEPLKYEETNLVNTVAEGVEMVRYIGHPNVRLLADFYHVVKNGETLDAVRQSGGLLAHTHIANYKERRIPSTTDGFDYSVFRDALAACGYNARLSLEGKFDGEKTVEQGRDALKALASFR